MTRIDPILGTRTDQILETIDEAMAAMTVLGEVIEKLGDELMYLEELLREKKKKR